MEDKETYQPIDMTEYPFEVDQLLDNGVKIVSLKKGNEDDSIAGYMFKIFEKYEADPETGERTRIYLEDVSRLVKNSPLTRSVHPEDKSILVSTQFIHHANFEHIGHLADPTCQWVFFVMPGEKSSRRCRPAVFLDQIATWKKGQPFPYEDESKVAKKKYTHAGSAPIDQIKKLVEDGKTNKEIAEELNLPIATVNGKVLAIKNAKK